MKKKGFTLIELLVVIAIIGILATIGLVALNGAREKARDATRKSDISQIAAGLALYYDDQNPTTYPGALSYLAAGSSPIMGTVPTDPQGGTDYNYEFCDSGQGYRLYATLESVSAGTYWVLNDEGESVQTDSPADCD